MKIVYVTCGSNGVGHLVRGLAIARGLERDGFDGDFQIITPIAPLPAMAETMERFSPTVCEVDSRKVLDPDVAPSTELAAALTASKPDLLIVDLFWAPLIHLRPMLDCDAWLIVRSCPPIWLVGNDAIRYDRDQYQRVIGIEPVEHEEIREHIAPLVVCNPDEIRTRDDFCERFGVAASREIVAYSHAGMPGEMEALKKTEEHDNLAIVRCDLHSDDAEFPLAPWLPGVDRVHCSAGYNSFWESRWLGFSDRTTFTVFRRAIDDPLWRVKANRELPMSENGADVLARMIVRG